MICQLGAESDPLAYIGHLVHVFRLARPALRRDATLWCNLGDSYAQDTKWGGASSSKNETSAAGGLPRDRRASGIPDKNLLGIPARAALALQADGWVWRNAIVWHKLNGMPESVRDRFTRAHEDVLLFGNSARYYFDADAVEEPAGQPNGEALRTGQNRMTALGHNSRTSTLGSNQGAPTRNRRDVLSIPTSPMPRHLRGGDEAHYAAWPPALVEVMVKAATANKACASCGAAWVRQVERLAEGVRREVDRGFPGNPQASGGASWQPVMYADLGFAPGCACAADTARCVVLDPFSGTGTTGAVCEALGRDSVLIDLGYQTLQAKRTDGIQIDMEALL